MFGLGGRGAAARGVGSAWPISSDVVVVVATTRAAISQRVTTAVGRTLSTAAAAATYPGMATGRMSATAAVAAGGGRFYKNFSTTRSTSMDHNDHVPATDDRLETVKALLHRVLTERDENDREGRTYDAAAINELGANEARGILKNVLTTLWFDPSEATMAAIDELLLAERAERNNTVAVDDMDDVYDPRVRLWRGDITRLQVGAIVNAANKHMLGCFKPNHPCIDNAIHCAAGPRLRAACRVHMTAQGALEATGTATITPGFCLPCECVLHTVGPIAEHKGHEQPEALASCYTSCLDLAAEHGLASVAFCCISTGVFGYPQEPAARIAIETVRAWLDANPESPLQTVVFNVFLKRDQEIYADLLAEAFSPDAGGDSGAAAHKVNDDDGGDGGDGGGDGGCDGGGDGGD